MKFFKLPDLGEGLQEAELVEWHVTAGDQVSVDQTLVVVETAKALVEIPSPQAGIIARCFGVPGDLIHINEPLVEFEGAEDDDAATVVGDIRSAVSEDDGEDFFIIGAASGEKGAASEERDAASTAQDISPTNKNPGNLRGARRAMAKAIDGKVGTASNSNNAHASCVTLFDDADVEHWHQDTDISVRLCQAIVAAVQRQPLLNSWFDPATLTFTTHDVIDLALAVDTEQGLFAPVLRNIGERNAESLRQGLDQLRHDVVARNIPLQELQGATLTLSNFGTLGRNYDLSRCGRYATPLIVPPSVAIVGAGDIRCEAVATPQGVAVHKVLPLSLTFDHRVITGAEAAIFLGALINALMNDDD